MSYRDERPTHADYLAMAHCDLRIAQAELAAAEAEVEKARIETEWHPEWMEILEMYAGSVERNKLYVKEAERQVAHHTAGVAADARTLMNRRALSGLSA